VALPEAVPLDSPAVPAARPRGGPPTARDAPAFDVHLDCYTGPFDLLLGLVSAHRLDITEVALSVVTDEFVAHLRRLTAAEAAAEAEALAAGTSRGAATRAAHLGQASSFLLVAATLLDLKAARLLPAAEVEDAEDLALLEARDLLFARLLQHRAYAQVAVLLGEAMAAEALHVPRAGVEVPLPVSPPPLELDTTPEQLAVIAARALAPRPAPPQVATTHLHAPEVDLAVEIEVVRARLAAASRRSHGGAAELEFSALVADAGSTAVVVGRFLAVLELYRRGLLDVEQAEPLAALRLRWTADGAAGADGAGNGGAP
jgi:segregation and condensation protein A